MLRWFLLWLICLSSASYAQHVTASIPLGTPSGPTATCQPGIFPSVEYDSNYIYTCVAANTWTRVPNNTWSGPTPSLGFYIGIALSGMDFPSCGVMPWGCPPNNAQMNYFASKNMMTVRLPFNWEGVQAPLGAALDAGDIATIDGLVANAFANGQRVVLDVHNFSQYNGINIGQPGGPTPAQFADLWQKLSAHYKSMPGIYGYDIMNEPAGDITLATWQTAAQLAVNAIRGNGDTNLILAECVGFSAAPQWLANCPTFTVSDPLIPPNLAYDFHNYADCGNTGQYLLPYNDTSECVTSPTVMATRAAQPIGWSASNNKGAMIHGEGNVPYYDTNWIAVLSNFYEYLQGVGVPTLMWSDGTFPTSYALNPSPVGTYLGYTIPASGVRDRDQMAVVTKYTSAPQPTTFYCAGPAQGGVNLASGDFVCKYEGTISGTHTITPTMGTVAGAWSPSTATLAQNTFNPVVTFKFTPSGTGTGSATFVDGGGLTSAMGAQSYVSLATSGKSVYQYMSSPLLFFWAPKKVISTYSATGNSLIAKGGDGTSQTFALSGGALDQSALNTFCLAHGTLAQCQATRLYDQSGNANDCVAPTNATFTQPLGPTFNINGQNSLLTLKYGSNSLPTGCATTVSILNLTGTSLFSVANMSSTNSSFLDNFIILTGGNAWTWPAGSNAVTSPLSGLSGSAGIIASAYHNYAQVVQAGDFNNFSSAYVDGGTASAIPSTDQAMWIDQAMDHGYNRYSAGNYFIGSEGQFAVVGGAASSGDIARAATEDAIRWNIPGPPISLVAHTSTAGGVTGGDSPAVDTTSADFLVGSLDANQGTTVTVSDSYSNTWTPLTVQTTTAACQNRLYYVANPTVGTGHTFTIAGTNITGTMQVAAFSGVKVTSPLDVQNGSNSGASSVTTIQPGSVTPSASAELIVSGACTFNVGAPPLTVSSGLTVTDSVGAVGGTNYGGAMGYLVQSPAAAINPTWTLQNTNPAAATIAVFKALP